MKRILIVTREFLPSASVAVKRPLGLVRHVLDCGWTPFVLTAHPRCQRLVDYSQEQDIRTISHIERVRCWSLWEHSKNWRDARPAWRYVLTWMRRVVAKATEELIPIDLAYPWAIAATKVGVSMVKRFGIDLIWSTQPPLTSLYLARRISQRTGVPYVVDYRDAKPPARNGQTSLRDGRYMLAERELLRDAAGLIYSAPAHEEILVEKHPFVTQLPRFLAYTGFDASETNVLPPYVFTRPTILHGGSLYGGQRRLDGFLKALEILRHHGSTNNQRLQFVQHGWGYTDPMYLTGVAGDLVRDQTLVIKPLLPRRQFLSACRGADILLLVIGRNRETEEHTGAVPGKTFDYFAARRPILVIGPTDGEAARMVTRLQRGIAVPDNNPEQIAHAIKKLLDGQGPFGSIDLGLDAICEYDISHIVRELSIFFDFIVRQ